MTLRISNADARRLFLHGQRLSRDPRARLDAAGLQALIEDLGFVQLDSINTVERAHHQILFSRSQSYRPDDLKHLHETEATLFENWTHDASIIPSKYFPYWRHRFAREQERLRERWQKWRRDGFAELIGTVRAHVEANGPTMARDLGLDEATGGTGAPKKGGDGWWDWHPSKTALEYLWRTGEVSVIRREGFQKVYDLSARAIPPEHHDHSVTEEAFVDWACHSALDRLGFATPTEITAFWEALPLETVKDWCARNHGETLVEVEIEGAGGDTRPALAFPDIEQRLAAAPPPPRRLRVLSPFDPAIRDRNRTERLFGYRYRIEVFVPEARREFGYYVFPLLEGDRLVGRIDMKHHRKQGELRVKGLWWERCVRASKAREEALLAELERIRRFTGAAEITFENGWRRS
ncbi:crosslink repair DNA glycosylase YcaQ family protein [Breoghania sp. L-A4]|uniref:winged helix-turn-helix domain-containing protein n=1 Tax=Breoghania sp. L-A4 TaxID=2304600 RepID=UPI000E35AB5D|nr:crosslink repair DNA glycosylase YcaQ family protein [Breoghania sp. L-A4]AXS41152.1 winged helix-turn-helix domain-containing protein [Breoghania sp. L-A4]